MAGGHHNVRNYERIATFGKVENYWVRRIGLGAYLVQPPASRKIDQKKKKDRVSLCSSGYPQTHHVDQARLVSNST